MKGGAISKSISPPPFLSSSPGTGGRSKVPPRPRRELSQCRSLEVSVGQGGSPWRRAAGSFLEFTAAAPPAASPAFAKWVYEVEGVLGRAGAGARLLPRAHSPDRESPGNPRFPLTSAPSTLPAAASPRLGAGEVWGGGGGWSPIPALPNHASPQGTFTSKIFIAASECQQLIEAFNLKYDCDYYHYYYYYFAQCRAFDRKKSQLFIKDKEVNYQSGRRRPGALPLVATRN